MRIPALERDQAPAEAQPLYDQLDRVPSAARVTFKVLAHSPRTLGLFLALGRALAGMEIHPRLKELAFIKTSRLNRSDV